MTDWSPEFAKERVVRIDVDTGKLTDVETGKVFNSHEEFQDWVSQKRAAAMQKLLLARDRTSDVENLPGTKDTGHDARLDTNW